MDENTLINENELFLSEDEKGNRILEVENKSDISVNSSHPFLR